MITFSPALTYVGISMPPFWFALIAIHFLAVAPQDWFGLSSPPVKFVGLHSVGSSGLDWDYLQHLILPVLTLSVQLMASWTRFQRSSTLDVLSSDYIRTARAKGVPRGRVIVRHAMRNSLIPLVTVIAVDAGLLFGGLIITETIFSIPGMGRLFFQSLLQGDVVVLEAWMLVMAIFILLFNLLADVTVRSPRPKDPRPMSDRYDQDQERSRPMWRRSPVSRWNPGFQEREGCPGPPNRSRCPNGSCSAAGSCGTSSGSRRW